MRRTRNIEHVCLLAVVGIAGCAHMGVPVPTVVPDRPGYTDTPTALNRGSIQLETGYTDDRTPSARYRSVGEVLLRVGVAGPVEARVFGNSYGLLSGAGIQARSGLEDLKLGAKLALIEQPDSVHAWKPSLAFLAATTIPTGASGIGSGAARPEAKLAASWTTATPFSLYANAGVNRSIDAAGWKSNAFGSVATWYAATPRVSFFAELLNSSVLGASAPVTTYVDGGVTFLVSPRLQLDFRVGRGARGDVTSERFVGAGIARRW
jgi:hypothetical protein